MSQKSLVNRVRALREAREWSQAELAERTELSRAGISAIESQRLVPSVEAAIAIAAVFECRVEDVFHRPTASRTAECSWAEAPTVFPLRYWTAEIEKQTWAFAVNHSTDGPTRHDGIALESTSGLLASADAAKTLVVATCDPAAHLLADEYQRQTGMRMVVLRRSSGEALELLKRKAVHAAGVHYAEAGDPRTNAKAAASVIEEKTRLLHMCNWEEGLALGSRRRIGSVRQAIARPNRWIGRLATAASRRYQDEVLGTKRVPSHSASDHRGVAHAVRDDWADVGVCLRYTSVESQLKFLSLGFDRYDLCFRDADASEYRLRELLKVVRSPSYRSLLADLPGYDASETGEMGAVKR
jgi:molybdate-binding protein/DNA-binding XRE family transcriptional regulator